MQLKSKSQGDNGQLTHRGKKKNTKKERIKIRNKIKVLKAEATVMPERQKVWLETSAQHTHIQNDKVLRG